MDVSTAQALLMKVCLGFLILTVPILAGIHLVPYLKTGLGKLKERKVSLWFMSFIAFVMILYGGSKGIRNLDITWDTGLSDDYTYITNAIAPCAQYPEGVELETNDLRVLMVKWTKAVYVPDFSTVTFYGLPRSNPEAEMTALFTCSVTNLCYPVLMPDQVTNFVYFMENSYIPDAPTRTNGVYHIEAAKINSDEDAETNNNVFTIPLGTSFREDGTKAIPEEGQPGDFVDQYITPTTRSTTIQTIDNNQGETER